MAGLRVAFLPVRRTVAALPVALGRQTVRVRLVRQTVLAVRPPGQTLAGTPQAHSRRGRGRRETSMFATTTTTEKLRSGRDPIAGDQ